MTRFPKIKTTRVRADAPGFGLELTDEPALKERS